MASTIGERLVVAPEVAEALRGGRPAVALESTLISHGLPYPQNLEVATASEAAVREAGAVPATVAIRDGRLLVGLEADDLEALANAPVGSVRKAARPSLAVALAAGGWAATTVSATMIAAHAAGIRVFATGGIGGVHRGALGIPGSAGPPTLDVSSDLEELARTPLAVVCAGPKAILDVPLTLEYLETRGVPVVAIGQPELPGFYARSSGIDAPISVDDVPGGRPFGCPPPRARSRKRDPPVRAGPRRCGTPRGRRARRGRAGNRRGGGERRPWAGPDTVAARPRGGADRGCVGAREHRARS